MPSNPRQITSADLFFFFHAPNPSINHVNFYCIKQVDYIFRCVCSVIDHRRRHVTCKEQQSRHSKSSLVVFFFFTRYDIICGVLQYTQRKNIIYLLNIYIADFNYVCHFTFNFCLSIEISSV